MTSKSTPAEANRIFYREEAGAYEATEDCLRSAYYQRRLRQVLAEALTRLAPNPLVLDACGGTGNIGAALHPHGVTPVVVDVSPEMTNIWRAKAARLGFVPEIHDAPIEEFLREDGRAWNLITFSSALHHLEDYTAVLLAAADNLAPAGLVLTIFDPTPAPRGIRVLRRLDFVIWLARARPLRFVELLVGALRRVLGPSDRDEHVGRMAERHAYTGIDDHELVRAVEGRGLEVVVHERYYDARLGAVRFLLRRIRQPSSFALVVRRPADRPHADDLVGGRESRRAGG